MIARLVTVIKPSQSIESAPKINSDSPTVQERHPAKRRHSRLSRGSIRDRVTRQPPGTREASDTTPRRPQRL